MAGLACVVSTDALGWQAETDSDGALVLKRKKLGEAAGGEKLGCSLCSLPPGSRSWPRHWHAANEEAIYVLSGRGTLLIGDDSVPLHPGDYAALPVGERYSHKVRNDSSDEDLTFLCFSTMIHPDVVVYPDSEKVGVFAGAAPGGRVAERTLKAFVPLAAEVDYWEDE